MAEVIKTVIDVDINTSGAASELRSLQQQINSFNLTLNKSQLAQGQASKVWAEGITNAVNGSGFFRAEMVKMKTSAAALDSTLRKGQGTLGQFFSAAFNKRSSMAAEVFALAAERARTMQTQFIATGKAAKGMQDAIAIRPLTAFSSEIAISSQRMQILNSMFRQGTTQLINFGKNVQWAGRQLMVGFTIPLTIFGTTAGRVFSDLEKQAVAFKKVYGDIFTTPVEVEQNLKAVEGLAREFTKYGIAAKDTLSLAAQAAAAGRRNSDLTDAVTESTRLATLGQMDQNSALETTIALQSAFRLSGQELADTINFLNMVENQTVVSLQDLAAAIPRVAPVIRGLGGDVKDMAVFLAAMQEGGVSAEQGANALKSGLGSLINPTKQAKEVLAGFKINIDSIVQTNRGDLMKTVMAFGQALSTLDEFSKQQALETLFGKYQYARLGALFENISREGSQAQQVIATMGYSTEELAKSAEKELSIIEQAFSVQLTAAVEKFKLAIAPMGQIFIKMAIPIVNMLTRVVEWFNRLPDGVKNITAVATAIGGVLLPAATMLFGLFSNLLGTFAKFTQALGIFGITLLKKGPIAAVKSLTQSTNYLSLSEIDAANAATQLGAATDVANMAMLEQVGSANSAKVAIDNLANSYRLLISEQYRASQTQPFLFGTGQAASDISKARPRARIKGIGLNKGGKVFTLNDGNTVPGTGNTDTVPAMLTPGEFVVNKESTKNNLGLLHAINAQKLNMGGGVSEAGRMFYGKIPSSISQAATNFILGNIPGFSASTNKAAAKLVGRSQAVRAARPAGVGVEGTILGKKNNFVYLFDKDINQQLVGIRKMRQFDKRGVPLDVLKSNMLTDEAMWMIDAFAGGPWKKQEYMQVLSKNFDDLVTKYPDKDIRFVDPKGMDRVKNLIGTPGYENVQFVSVKDLHNKELFDTLDQNHYDILMTEATQTVKELRNSRSRGNTRLKDSDKGIPGMGSYTKKTTNWRGEDRPEFKQASHMLNMGGMVNGIQKLRLGGVSGKVGMLRKAFSMVTTKFHRAHIGRPTGIALQTMVSNIWKNSPSKRAKLLQEYGIDAKYASKLANKDLDTAIGELQARGMGFYSPGFAGGTSAITGGNYNFLTEELRRIKAASQSQKQVRNLTPPPKFIDVPSGQLVKAAKALPDYILEGSPPLTVEDSKLVSSVLKQINADGRTKEGKVLLQIINQLDQFSTLSPSQYKNEIRKRMGAIHKAAGGKKQELDFIFNELDDNYTAQDIIDRIYNPKNPALSGKTKGLFAHSSSKTTIGQINQKISDIAKKLFGSGFAILGMNKGGMIPNAQYLNGGGTAKILASLYKSKPRNEMVDELFLLDKDIRDKIFNGSIKKRKDFGNRADRMIFDNAIYRTIFPRNVSDKDTLLDVLSSDYRHLLSNEHLLTISSLGDKDVLNLMSQQFGYRFKNPKDKNSRIVKTINETFERSGISLNKGGMIPGVQYAMAGKLIKDVVGKRFAPKTIEAVTRFVQSHVGNIADIRAGADPKLLRNMAPAFKRSKEAQMLERGLFLPRRFTPGETVNLGSLQSFSLQGKDVTRHIVGNPIAEQMRTSSYFYNVRKKQVDFYQDALNKKRAGTYRGLESEEQLLKQLELSKRGMNEYKKEYDDLIANNIPSIIKLKTPSGTMMVNVDDVVPKDSQTYMGKPISEKERILHNANIKVNKVYDDEAGRQIIDADLLSAERLKFNKGNIVPGTGNTDTVPAMLTPGEFVVNKESTKQNYDLLTAINQGKVDKYAIGGVVKGALKGAAGLGAGFAATAGLEGMGMNSMLANILGFTIGPALASSKGLSLIAKAATPLTSALGLSTTALMGVVGPIAALSIGMIALNKMANNAVQSGGELIKSMYGSSQTMKQFAEAFGRENIQQRLARQRAEIAGGAPIGAEAQQYSTQFIESQAGQDLVKRIESVKKVSGTKGRDEALLRQLTRGVVTGSITAEEAKAIALDVGKKLGDQTIGARISARITELVGPDGSKVVDNMLKINSIISPQIDMSKIEKDVSKQWENLGLGSKLGMILTGKGTDEMLVDMLAQAAIEANAITQEQLDLLRLELESGNITIEEFVKKKDELTQASLNTTLNAQEEINKKFGEGTDKALAALRKFREEFEKEFQIKVSTLSPEDRKNAEKAQEILRKPDIVTANPQNLAQQVNLQLQAKKTDEEKRKFLQSLGLDPNIAYMESTQIITVLTQTFLADQKLAQVVAEKLFGDQAKQELQRNAADALALLDPIFQAKIGELLSEDTTGELKDKLVKLFEIDPAVFQKLQALFSIAGPEALTNALKLTDDELQKYLNNIDKITALPAEIKGGINLESFIGDEKKVAEFIKELEKIEPILEAIKKNKNLSIDAKMKLVADQFGKDSPIYKMISEGIKQGKPFEFLIGLAISEDGKKIAAAYATLADPNASMPAKGEAAKVIAEFEKSQPPAGNYQDPGTGEESALEQARKQAKQQRDLDKALPKLFAAGLTADAAETLSPETLIELSKLTGKALQTNIKLFNQQAESVKNNKLAFEELAKQQNPLQQAIENSQKTVEKYNNQINELNKTVEKANRADELDRRKIEDRSKALEKLSKKEADINKAYDARISALDKVSKANDRLAEKQRQQTDLATALTSGDIAGAAQAAAAMTQTDAQYQIEDTKTALEQQRQAELDGLTESVNGKLMTRKQIQAEIDSIEETIYQRGLNLRTTYDSIYTLEQQIKEEKQTQDDLNQLLTNQAKDQSIAALSKLDSEKKITSEKRKQAKTDYAAYLRKQYPKLSEKEIQDKLGQISFAFGGMVRKYAFGGNVSYRGSNEPPPPLRMAFGSMVPGLGNTDRVPALLTPGEFVVRKAVAKANMPLLKSLNSDVFPSLAFNSPNVNPDSMSSTSTVLNNTPVYNSYNVNVNVPNTSASPEEIANVVVSRIRRSMDTNIRGVRR